MKEIEPEKGLKDLDKDESARAGREEILQSIAETNSLSTVALMRIYDVLMCMYGEQNAEDAIKLAGEHAKGHIRSRLPFIDPDYDIE